MELTFTDDRPIFVQIAEGIEDAILAGAFPEESQIPSITDFSVSYRINPATALKGINMLVEQNILFKKRGVGMFVSPGATEQLRLLRKKQFFSEYIEKLVQEAGRLSISKEELINMIKERM